MFDPVTREFLASAPSLPGLPAESLADEFTATYIEIATARLTLNTSDPQSLDQLAEVAERMGRVANVLESQVILGVAGERCRAAAFVAGSARQVVFQISQLLATSPGSRVDEFAISADLAASLLFLISERSADAYEMSRLIDAHGMTGLHGQIAIAISYLARGQLERIAEIVPERFKPRQSEPEGSYASDLLYARLLEGLHLLARVCLGSIDIGGFDAARELFAEVRELSVDFVSEEDIGSPLSIQAPSIFAGPHHLAGLLERTAGTLRTSAVTRLDSPSGADAQIWREWLKTEAVRYPFLWENHQRAILTGFLDVGKSLVMTSPTGSGKTTLSILKIAATLCGGKTVVYLAPTHALVNQVERDLNERLSQLARASSVEESLLEEIGQQLPDVAVLTPERCFALLTFAPHLFKGVGLLVFDECHLMGVARDTKRGLASAFDRRSIDAMLCLLSFAAVNLSADYLLLSAMISNGTDLASWLADIIKRPCFSFDDKWKPTRQLKACICYERKDVNLINIRLAEEARSRNPFPKAVPADIKKLARATPLALFSGGMGWHPNAPETFALRSIVDEVIPLGVARRAAYRRWALTANRNEVAAELAIRFSKAGLKVIVFCESIPTTVSVARRLNDAFVKLTPTYDEAQKSWRQKLVEELGSEDCIYDAGTWPAAVHHGELLLEERLLVEQTFRNRASGVNVLAATSTLAQGLNLPCEVVILAGTDRIDESDPEETSRSDLLPHEILNALGRAGRAGLAATGLAIVVPADLVHCTQADSKVEDAALLHTIFSASDQCAPLGDPISTLYDSIVSGGATTSEEAAYLLKRLALSLNATAVGVESFEDLTRRSFGFYLKARESREAAEMWLGKRRQQLQGLIEAAAVDEARNWIQELAAKSGSSPTFIATLSNAFESAPSHSPDAYDWMSWLLKQLSTQDDDFDTFIRPDDVERVFGRGYTSAGSIAERRERARDAILTILPSWFSAQPLNVLEHQIVTFINAHEGQVKRKTNEDSKAKRGRRFALRLVSDLSYLAGVLSQVATMMEASRGLEALPITQSLPQLVRRGFNSPYHLYLDRQQPGRSRQAIERHFKEVGAKIKRDPADDWEKIRTNVASSLMQSLLADGAITKLVHTQDLAIRPEDESNHE